MKAIVDANILFSSIVKNKDSRKVWFNPDLELSAPEFILAEMVKYRALLEKKSGKNSADFERLLAIILGNVEIIPDYELKPYLPAAESLVNDPKDFLYLACAIKENALLWSNDKELKKQGRVKVLNTQEMIKEFGSL